MADDWKREETVSDNPLFLFESPGDTLELTVTGIRHNVPTKLGVLTLVDGIKLSDGTKVSFIMTAGLKAYAWENFTNRLTRITFSGREVNPATGRKYKAFEVYTRD